MIFCGVWVIVFNRISVSTATSIMSPWEQNQLNYLNSGHKCVLLLL